MHFHIACSLTCISPGSASLRVQMSYLDNDINYLQFSGFPSSFAESTFHPLPQRNPQLGEFSEHSWMCSGARGLGFLYYTWSLWPDCLLMALCHCPSVQGSGWGLLSCPEPCVWCTLKTQNPLQADRCSATVTTHRHHVAS